MNEMMIDQLSLFSVAEDIKKEGKELLYELNLAEALDRFDKAVNIDPSLADISMYIAIIRFLNHNRCNKGGDLIQLARTWQLAYKETLQKFMSLARFKCIERILVQRILAKTDSIGHAYIDESNQVLPVGYCYLVEDKVQEAHRNFVDQVTTDTYRYDARLWSYLGDASWTLEHYVEARGNYKRALFLDAHSVDFQNIRHDRIRHLYCRLLEVYNKRVLVESLMPIAAWFEDLIQISPGDDFIADYLRDRIEVCRKNSHRSLVNCYDQFARCLFLEQFSMDIDFDLRFEMKELCQDLFSQYMSVMDPPLQLPVAFNIDDEGRVIVQMDV